MMPGQWDEALRLLRPAMSAADQAAQARQGREEWLRSLIPVSMQYGHQINDVVAYFLDTAMRHQPNLIADIDAGRTPNFETVRGYVESHSLHGWRMRISTQEWPQKPHDAYLCIQTNGRWYFGYVREVGPFHDDKVVTVFGFNELGVFVPSSFPLVEHGTVVTIVQLSLLALLHHYGLPLPS